MSAYITFLKNIAEEKKIHVASYPGNSGDELIMKATYDVLKYNKEFINNKAEDADIIIIPGGNFSMWEIVLNMIRSYVNTYSGDIVIGPSSFNGNYTNWRSFLSEHQNRIAGLFPRDMESYNNLISLNLTNVDIHLSPDIAFNLEKSWFIKSLLNSAEERYNLISLRNDHESKLYEDFDNLAFSNFLPSRLGKKIIKKMNKLRISQIDVSNPLISDVSLLNFSLFCDHIANAKSIHTDRLHVAILAILLQKEVHILPTRHNKIKGVLDVALANIKSVDNVFYE